MSEIKPGIYEGVDFETYLSWPCFHKSMVSAALRSTAHLHQYLEEEKESSKVMDFGSLVDCLLLEPHTFEKDFVKRPETAEDAKGVEKPWDNRMTSCKQWNQEQREKGLTIFSKGDMERAKKIIKNIREHKTAKTLFQGGKSQVAIVWEDQETGIMCKGRLDYLQEEGINDLKITYNAAPGEFSRTVGSQLYHVQAALYSDGLAALNGGVMLPFRFVAAEDEEPHCVGVYDLGGDTLLTGQILYRRALRRYKDYLKAGPKGYSDFAEEIDILPYKMVLNEEV